MTEGVKNPGENKSGSIRETKVNGQTKAEVTVLFKLGSNTTRQGGHKTARQNGNKTARQGGNKTARKWKQNSR